MDNGPQINTAAPAQQPRGPVPAGVGASNYKHMPVRSVPPGQPGAAVLSDQEPLSLSVLASASPIDQKQMLGCRLFPIIQVSRRQRLFVRV